MPELDVTHLLFPFAEQGIQHCHVGRALLQRCQCKPSSNQTSTLFVVSCKRQRDYFAFGYGDVTVRTCFTALLEAPCERFV